MHEELVGVVNLPIGAVGVDMDGAVWYDGASS